MKTVAQKMQGLNGLLCQSAIAEVSLFEVAKQLASDMDANVYIVSGEGRFLGYAFMDGFYCPTMDDVSGMDKQFSPAYNAELLAETRMRINLDKDGACVFGLHESCFLQNRYSLIVPVNGDKQRLCTLVLARGECFNDDDAACAEYAGAFIAMLILRSRLENTEEILRQKTAASVAIAALSYSELEAIEHIFSALNNTDGLLVASKIADRVGITRSVIVNALRKLESAGLIEARSLGMKGTFIRIANKYIFEALSKAQSLNR